MEAQVYRLKVSFFSCCFEIDSDPLKWFQEPFYMQKKIKLNTCKLWKHLEYQGFWNCTEISGNYSIKVAFFARNFCENLCYFICSRHQQRSRSFFTQVNRRLPFIIIELLQNWDDQREKSSRFRLTLSQEAQREKSCILCHINFELCFSSFTAQILVSFSFLLAQFLLSFCSVLAQF